LDEIDGDCLMSLGGGGRNPSWPSDRARLAMGWAGLDRKRPFTVGPLSGTRERDAVEQIGCYQVAGKCLAKGWILGLAVADDAEWDGLPGQTRQGKPLNTTDQTSI
jgi:hypothetical protein